MAPENGSETGSYSRFHLDTVGAIKGLQTRMDAVEKDIEVLQKKSDEATKEIATAHGYVKGAVPDLQTRLESAFKLIGESGETADVYYGQIREMAKDLEQLRADVNGKASKEEVDKKADKGETEAGIKNNFTWVKAGFICVAVAFLLWVLALWGGFLEIGGKKTEQKPPSAGVVKP
jgi:hypothetical protein